MSSNDEAELQTKREKYNEYMRNYRLLNHERVNRIGKRQYYKRKYADILTSDDNIKYKDHLDKVCIIKQAINDLFNENPETGYAVIMDIINHFEKN